jgi:predicted nucleic-acid-binding protein
MRSAGLSSRSSRAMIGIDTNLLVRVIVADEPKQTAVARSFIREHCSAEEPGFVSNIVLAEIAWTLATGYGYERNQIADAIERIMETVQLQIESSTDVASALAQYRAGAADFAVCLLGQSNLTAGCSHTVTFDRKAAKLAGFELLKGS